jgi:hypothetical protein
MNISVGFIWKPRSERKDENMAQAAMQHCSIVLARWRLFTTNATMWPKQTLVVEQPELTIVETKPFHVLRILNVMAIFHQLPRSSRLPLKALSL